MRATEATTASRSHGASVRRSMISASMPSAASCSAAARERCTVAPQVTMVRSSPGRTVAALPSGSTYSRPGKGSSTYALAEEVLVLEEEHRILAGKCGAQQARDVAGAGREDHDEARDVGEDRLAALRVPDRPAGDVAADRAAQHHRHDEGPVERQRVVAASERICCIAGQM